MGLLKPNLTVCVDGKGHSWMIVSEEMDGDRKWEHRWCQKCGALTQVTYDPEGQPIAIINEDGSHFLMVPKILGVIIK